MNKRNAQWAHIHASLTCATNLSATAARNAHQAVWRSSHAHRIEFASPWTLIGGARVRASVRRDFYPWTQS
jgi:hypothetical protein